MADYELYALPFAWASFPLSAMLVGCDDHLLRDIPLTYFLIRGEDRQILIDTGTKALKQYPAFFSHNYSFRDYQPPEAVLAPLGLKPDQITDVILTHCHFDHMGNMEAFPNARFYLQRQEYQGWRQALTWPRSYA